MMDEAEKSDVPIVAKKPANEAGRPAEEWAEPRGMAKGNARQAAMLRAQDRDGMSQGLDRVRQAARDRKEERFTTLLHHVDAAALHRAYEKMNRQAAVGVDGVTWKAYGRDLGARIADLLERVHRGAYRAQPSRRTYIPKPDGRRRPLGIAALEDKLLQSAVAEVLNAIYEEDFLGFSYGFRPKRRQHDALDALAYALHHRKVNFILDADIRAFFDTIDHERLMEFVERRIGDTRILRLIRKWLRAGVLEDGVWSDSPQGTPQGAVISPLLANVYLHYVVDLWVDEWRATADGDVIVVRYADDIVFGFQHRVTAERFLAQLRARLGQHELDLHPDKTRLIEFGRYAGERRERRGEGRPETFNFLGFTHIAGTDRRGAFQLKRVTRRDRMRDRLRAIKEGLQRRLHATIEEQGTWLGMVMGGYFAYHAVPTNQARLWGFRGQVRSLWFKALRRRSQKDTTTWERIGRLAKQWLPSTAIRHPWPQDRFRRHHPRWEPGAGKPHAGFCAGGAG